MIFSSFIFLYLFLPLTVLLYYLTPRNYKNYLLLFASLIFYSWGAPKLLVPLLISCAIDYYLSLRISTSSVKQKHFLYLAVFLNLTLLAYFKYANFFITEFNFILNTLGVSSIAWTKIALPVGISFFTFQKISYLVDVYRKDTPTARNVFDYILYVILFPQLIAGPIVRYLDVAREIISRKESINLFISGVCRFSIGLAKKVLIADAMGTVADNIFDIPTEQASTFYAWLGITAYAFQIYFDFAGYSDMAIGLGWMFGFKFKENFNKPYQSQNITEFWRRWHISLSSFMREYLYYPLGGNRSGAYLTYRNLLLVFLLSGFWHGANWTFIFWGLFHGTFLIIDRLFWLKISANLPKLVNVAITFVIVLFGWVLFRAENMAQALDYAQVLLGLHNPSQILMTPRGLIIDNRSLFIFTVALFFAFYPGIKGEAIKLREDLSCSRIISYTILTVVLIFLATAYLIARGHTPFLYYRF